MRRVRTTAALFVAATAVAFTAACGGGSGDSSGTGPNANGGGNNAFTAYVECLQKNGVTITMPSFGARNRPSGGASRGPGEGYPRGGTRSGGPRPSGSRFPLGGFPGGGFGIQKPAGVDDATWEKAQSACASLRPSARPGTGNRGNGRNAAFQNCMKDHGVTITEGQRLDPNDATVKKALETCRVLQQPQPSATPTA